MSDPRANLTGPALDEAPRCSREPGGGAPELDGPIERLGPILVHCIFSASKTAQIYDLSNRAVQTVLSRLRQTIADLGNVEGRIAMTVATDLLLINDVRIVVDPQSMGPVLHVIDEMKRKRVEEIDFDPETTLAELGAFAKAFSAEPSEEDVFGELSRKLADAGVKNIRLTEWIERVKYLRDARVDRREVREESNKVMARAVLFMGEVVRAIEQRRPIQLPKAHRLTQQMADIIKTDETILVGLASIKDYDEYTFSHSVNVSVLSMLLADRMGLHKSDTVQVGVAALFHDVGKTHVPQSILNKAEPLTNGEWKLMERHPILGVIELSRARSLEAILDPLFVSLQHHVLYHGKGYPQKPGPWVRHPFVPIITVADVFDAMTTPRVYRKNTLTPDRALLFIAQKSGEMFDPTIAKIFIRAMGVYPVGTVVELEDGERAVVVRQNPSIRLLHRPVVAPLRDGAPPGEPIDLAELDAHGSTYRRTVARSIHDTRFECQKTGCFLVK